jgi:hypothetical protein
MALNRPETARTVRVGFRVEVFRGLRLVVREQDAQYNTTRPLEPSYSLHTVLLKVESYNDTPLGSAAENPAPARPARAACGASTPRPAARATARAGDHLVW